MSNSRDDYEMPLSRSAQIEQRLAEMEVEHDEVVATELGQVIADGYVNVDEPSARHRDEDNDVNVTVQGDVNKTTNVNTGTQTTAPPSTGSTGSSTSA